MVVPDMGRGIRNLNLEMCLNGNRDSKKYFLVVGIVFPAATVVLLPAKWSRNRSTGGRDVTTSVRQFEISL